MLNAHNIYSKVNMELFYVAFLISGINYCLVLINRIIILNSFHAFTSFIYNDTKKQYIHCIRLITWWLDNSVIEYYFLESALNAKEDSFSCLILLFFDVMKPFNFTLDLFSVSHWLRSFSPVSFSFDVLFWFILSTRWPNSLVLFRRRIALVKPCIPLTHCSH